MSAIDFCFRKDGQLKGLSRKNLAKVYEWAESNQDDSVVARSYMGICAALGDLQDVDAYECLSIELFRQMSWQEYSRAYDVYQKAPESLYDARDLFGRIILEKILKPESIVASDTV